MSPPSLKPAYVLTRSAAADLRKIAKRTLQKWGDAQAFIYAEKLEQCFSNIAKKKIPQRSFSKKFPQVKSVKCEHHYVFFIHPENSPPIIVAVFYRHMDMLARLSDRF